MHGLVEKLREARDLLEKCWIPWKTRDGKGGHCHVGVLLAVSGDSLYEMRTAIDASCRRLFPELEGAEKLRPEGYYDYFGQTPGVYINNHGARGMGGKQAILMAYDDAILHAELREMLREETLKQNASASDHAPVADCVVQHC